MERIKKNEEKQRLKEWKYQIAKYKDLSQFEERKIKELKRRPGFKEELGDT